MNTIEDKNRIVDKLKINRIHPQHDAMLDECCEIAPQNHSLSKNEIIYTVQVGFLTAKTTLNGLILY